VLALTTFEEPSNMATEHHTDARCHVKHQLHVVAALAILGLAAATSPPAAAGPFDGTYTGTQRETQNNNSGACMRINQDHATIKIENGHFTRAWRVTLEVDVAADGSFKASKLNNADKPMRVVEIKGRIAGAKLEADIGTDLCAAHLSLTKS
jgi:hypothetical protein